MVIHELERGGLPYTDEDAQLITLFIEKSLRREPQTAPPTVRAKRPPDAHRRTTVIRT